MARGGAPAALPAIDEKGSYDDAPFAPEATVTAYSKRKDAAGKLYTSFAVAVALRRDRWVVQRRFSDFVNLHNKLETHITLLLEESEATSPLPALPSARVFGNMQPAFLMQRLAALDEYTRSIVAAPDLREHPAVAKFLELPSGKGRGRCRSTGVVKPVRDP